MEKKFILEWFKLWIFCVFGWQKLKVSKTTKNKTKTCIGPFKFIIVFIQQFCDRKSVSKYRSIVQAGFKIGYIYLLITRSQLIQSVALLHTNLTLFSSKPELENGLSKAKPL